MPVYIRAGKRLPLTAAEVVVEFHRPPREVFGDQGGRSHVRMRLGPDVCVAMGLRVKRPGERMIGEIVELMLAEHPAELTPPYQRLLGDAMRGDSELFGREDVVDAQWRIVEPILDDAAAVSRIRAWNLGAGSGRRADRRATGLGATRKPPAA